MHVLETLLAELLENDKNTEQHSEYWGTGSFAGPAAPAHLLRHGGQYHLTMNIKIGHGHLHETRGFE